MMPGAALARFDSGFSPRAALLSLLGHGLAFGALATFVAAPSPPDPAPSYAVLFELPAAAAPAPAVPVVPAVATAPAEPAVVEPEPAPPTPPVVLEEPAPAPPLLETALLPEPVATPVAAAPSVPKPPRPRPVPRPAKTVEPAAPVEMQQIAETPRVAEMSAAIPAEAPAPAPAPVAAPAAVAAVPAGPAPIPVVTDARFRERPIPPVYPRRAIELGLRGTAVLRALVQPDGSTAEIIVWRSSGVDQLDAAALGAVRLWRFEPARRDGDAIVAWVEIPVRFELN